MKIKKLIGYNENAVKIQVYTALISYLLMYIFKKNTKSSLTMLTVMRIVRTNMLELAGRTVYKFLGQSP